MTVSKLTNGDHEKILKAIRNGASVHQIALNWKLSINDAQKFIDQVSQETREGAAQHRIVLRGLLREQAPMALKTLVDISNSSLEMKDQHELNILALRFRAADKILQYATKFMTEDIPTSAVEQGKAEEMLQTIFDFESVVSPDGATTLIAKPVLKLVGEEE